MADTFFVNATAAIPGTVVVAPWLNDVNTNVYPILGGVAGTNAITATGPSTLVAYARGTALRFIPVIANTGAVTINISGLGVVNITKYGTTPLVAGDLVAGMWAYINYDSTRFQLINPRTADVSTATGVLPVANGGTGTTGSALQGRLLNVQRITATGVYTPTAGTNSVVVDMVGGGGGGGSAQATGASQLANGGGGGMGAYSVGRFTSAFSGVTVTIGTGGATDTAGTATSFGALMTAPGGSPGAIGTATSINRTAGGAGGVAGTGGNIVQAAGWTGGIGFSVQPFGLGGMGANSPFGTGGTPGITSNGGAASGFGAGGGGGANDQSTGAIKNGGTGAPGLVLVYEYS